VVLTALVVAMLVALAINAWVALSAAGLALVVIVATAGGLVVAGAFAAVGERTPTGDPP
jgi:hypothetical protein